MTETMAASTATPAAPIADAGWAARLPRRAWTPNRAGRAMAMCFYTPLRRGGALRLWLRLLLYRYGLGIFARSVYKLSFLHYAHWTVVRRLPGQRWRQPGYLLFESNYNGPWHNYIETFSSVVGGGISKILRTSAGFPGVVPVRAFKDYLEGHEYVLANYYSAYEGHPEASASVITAALDLSARFRRFAARAGRLGPGEFALAYARFLAEAQASLAGTPPRRVPRRWLASRARNLTVVAPIRPGQVPATTAALARHHAALPSPWCPLGDLHLGRWTVLDWAQVAARPGPVQPLEPPCLLFTAEIQGRRGPFIRRLVTLTAGAADEVWGGCEGWPGATRPRQAARFLRRRQVRSHLFFSAYGRYGPDDVRHALDGRRRILAFVEQAQGRSPADQLAAFRRLTEELRLERGA